jgi:hypothetical protein
MIEVGCRTMAVVRRPFLLVAAKCWVENDTTRWKTPGGAGLNEPYDDSIAISGEKRCAVAPARRAPGVQSTIVLEHPTAYHRGPYRAPKVGDPNVRDREVGLIRVERGDSEGSRVGLYSSLLKLSIEGIMHIRFA